MTPEHLPTEQYEAQLAEKVVRLQSMMAPFSDLVPEVFRSPVSHYRMRAEFRIWHDGDDLYHIIFDQQTKSRIRVDSFPAASELINQLMTAMIAGVRNNPVLRHKLFQIDYLTTLSNQAVVSLLYHKKLDDEWRQEAEALRDALRAQNLNVHLIGRATKTKIELDQDYIDERLPVAGKEMIYRQVENSFTQPNAAMNIQNAGWQGVTLNTTRGHFYRAALEGLTAQLQRNLQMLEKIGHFKASELLLVGGGSRNTLWNQIKANMLDIPVKVLDDAETTVAGAALFGWYGVGEFNSPEEARAQIHYQYRYFYPQTEPEFIEEV